MLRRGRVRAGSIAIAAAALSVLGGCGGGPEGKAEPGNGAARGTRAVLEVEGMTCGGCEAAIQLAVGRLEGIEAVDADYEAGTVEIAFDPARVTLDDVAETIRKLGYKPKPPAEPDTTPPPETGERREKGAA